MNVNEKHSRAAYLGPHGRLRSDLWIDRRPHLGLLKRVLTGRIRPHEVATARRFVREGWTVIRPGFDRETLDAAVADADRLWTEKPDDVAFAYRSLLRPMSEATPEDRAPSCRIADLHDASDAAAHLFLDPVVHRWIGLLFGAPGVATQSLYFEWGSHQELHRDPIHVKMPVAAHLLAAWIALEDIHPDSGPLVYVPGSHRLPYYQFEPGVFEYDPTRYGDDEAAAGASWDRDRCAEAGLSTETFLPKKGDVLLWHHSLLHGGSPAVDPRRTRKSLVVHFTTAGTADRTWNSYRRSGGRGPWADGPCALWADEVLRRDEARGFRSPIRAVGGLDSDEAARRAVPLPR